MISTNRIGDSILRSVLEWAGTHAEPALLPDFALGMDRRERGLLGALGGLARAISETNGHHGSHVPSEIADWWFHAPSPPDELVEQVRRGIQSGRDLFGELYTATVSISHRRKLGTVFTPPYVAAHMFTRCKQFGFEPATVIDPGAGVGAFTINAANELGVPVVAVDINLATLGFLAARSHLIGLKTSTHVSQGTGRLNGPGEIQLVRDDFLKWLPSGLPQTTPPSLIVGNPPYTRHQEMTQHDKESARVAVGSLVSSGLAGMAAYFLAASLRFLRRNDALCMILPGSWMQANYGLEIRRHLWGLTQRRVQIDVFSHQVQVFPKSKVDAVVLWVGPQEESRRPMTMTEMSLDGSHVRSLRSLHVNRSGEPPKIFPRTISEWRPSKSSGAALGDFFVVRRGIATGRNAFFMLTDVEVEKRKIPDSTLVPVISSIKKLDVDIIDDATFSKLYSSGAKRWMLMLKPNDIHLPSIRRYLTEGTLDGVANAFLAKQRRHWFALEDIEPAPLLLQPMTKKGFRVVRNLKGVRHTNNLFGLYPLTENVDIERFSDWLRSSVGQRALLRVARRYGDGMYKLEPRAVREVEVPQSLALL